jgi:hypothetical protein
MPKLWQYDLSDPKRPIREADMTTEDYVIERGPRRISANVLTRLRRPRCQG